MKKIYVIILIAFVHIAQCNHRTDDHVYENSYLIVKKRFTNISYIQQSNNRHHDFKSLVINAVKQNSARYITCAVDDIIITDYIDLNKCVEALDKTNAYGFYLRLGKNIDQECYPSAGKSLDQPLFSSIDNNICVWKFIPENPYWGYPHTLDLAIMRKKDVLTTFESLYFVSPNTLEGEWARCWQNQMDIHGLCFSESKMVNIPMNVVQDNLAAACLNSYSASDLLISFQEGYKIDRKPLFKIKNRTSHIIYTPTFIMRD